MDQMSISFTSWASANWGTDPSMPRTLLLANFCLHLFHALNVEGQKKAENVVHRTENIQMSSAAQPTFLTVPIRDATHMELNVQVN